MSELASKSIEFTIRHKWYGPVIYVRTTYPAANSIGRWKWNPWRKANDSQRNAALVKLLELNK